MIREGYADANGLKSHFAETGDVHAPATFFLHGFPEFSGMWKRVITSLGDHLHCIAPDLTGYNLSEKPADLLRYRTRRVVEDLASFIEMFTQGSRGDKKINLVAHDWGGALAWASAFSSSMRCIRLPSSARWRATPIRQRRASTFST